MKPEELLPVTLHPIGMVRTRTEKVPRHWSVSDVTGEIHLYESLAPGLRDIQAGDKIIVLFHFHKSPDFSTDLLFQTPPNKTRPKGVFSICSPVRPNPIGLSVLEVLETKGNRLSVKGLDMIDGTPVLDIKPHITG